jgi:diguanylate cyclase (GGDEF)-like protein
MITGPSQDHRNTHGACDALTGAYTRALFQERFPICVEQAQGAGLPLALCVFDLDYFKSINDAYGHRRGDQVLRGLVERLLPHLRATDQLFRYGGDEFVLMLPNTSKPEAMLIAQRLLEQVCRAPFAGAPPLSLSLSIGVATLPEDGGDPETLFEAADQRSYRAKREGRGRVIGNTAGLPIDPLAEETSRLIEREEAEETLRSFLTCTTETRRGVLTIAGPSGSGRTRLLRYATETAERQGWATLMLTGSPSLKSRPYGVLDQHEWPGKRADQPDTHAATLQEALAARGQGRALITVDNLCHIDRATRYLLRDLALHSDLPCLAIAYVEDFPCAAHFMPDDIMIQERIKVSPLSRHGVAVWLRNILHWEPEEEFVEWLHSVTEGRPGWIRTGLTVLRERQALTIHENGGWTVDPHYHQITFDQFVGKRATETPPQPPPHNLPALLTEFVGRDQARQEVAAQLDRGRLITILGPGGFGKTRLSIQLAGELLCDFVDGVWFIPLASRHHPEQIPEAIANALGLLEESGRPIMATLKDYLASRHTLIVLDNCEHLVDACSHLTAELIHHCHNLHILATSRHALNVPGEIVWRIPALTLPEPAKRSTDGAELLRLLSRSEAVQLFVNRAEEAHKTFRLTPENAQWVAQICSQLEGIPLALELAAARVRAMPVEQIARRLNDRFRLLIGGNRTSLPHHQTLRALIDWSYDLLSDQERNLLCRLSVFAGGATLEAAEQVCSDSQADLDRGAERRANSTAESEIAEWQVADLLMQLVDKSLVMYLEKEGEGRYHLLETIRQYACERLCDQGAQGSLHDRHLGYFLALAEEGASHLFGPDQAIWLHRLEVELRNLSAALDWCQEQPDRVLEGLGLVTALERFWDLHAHLTEGRTRCEAMLALEGASADPAAQARAFLTQGRLARRQNDLEAARLCIERSLAMGRELGDRPHTAQALRSLATLLFTQGDTTGAQTLIQQSLEMFQEQGDALGIGYALCLAGLIAGAMRDIPQAKRCHEESLALFRKLGNTQGIAMELCNLGEITLDEGDLATARECQQECLRLDRELGDRIGMAYPLENLAGIALRQAQYERAACLMGAAAALREATGTSHFGDELGRYERELTTIRAALGESAFTYAWDNGRNMSLDQTLAYASGSS